MISLLALSVFLVLAVSVFLFYACSVPSSQILGPALVEGPSDSKRVVLTFDDGPAEPYTSQLLDILRDHRVPATFFVCGKNVERYPEIVRRILAEKHTIGNHTFTHPFLYFKNQQQMAEEIDRTQAAIERVTGFRPRLFRPPYGARWFGLFRVLRQRGLNAVQWSAASFDWVKKNRPRDVVRITLDRLRNGAVILMHDGREPRALEDIDASTTVAALPAIIEGVREAGFEFVPVEEFL